MRKFDFKKILRYFRWRSEGGTSINILRDWKIAVFCFIVLALAFSAIDAYIFWQCQREGELNISGASARNEKPVTVDREKLKTVLEKISKRRAEFEKALTAPGVKDPSL